MSSTIRGERYGFADTTRHIPAHFEITNGHFNRPCRARRKGNCSNFAWAAWRIMGPLRFDFYCETHLPPKHRKYIVSLHQRRDENGDRG